MKESLQESAKTEGRGEGGVEGGGGVQNLGSQVRGSYKAPRIPSVEPAFWFSIPVSTNT